MNPTPDYVNISGECPMDCVQKETNQEVIDRNINNIGQTEFEIDSTTGLATTNLIPKPTVCKDPSLLDSDVGEIKIDSKKTRPHNKMMYKYPY